MEKADHWHRRLLLRARRERPSPTLPIVWMKSRRLKEPSLSLKDYVLWPSIQASKQESAPNETGERCDNVRRTNPERSMTAWGHDPNCRPTGLCQLWPSADIAPKMLTAAWCHKRP